MDNNYMHIMKIKIERTLKALKINRMEPYYIETKNELIPLLKQLVKEGSTISFGGSQTLEETGALQWFYDSSFKINDRYKKDLTKEEINSIHHKAFTADYLITSSNAISEDGKLINIDGLGSRLAPMIYGPNNVIVVAGMNKIVENEEEGYHRIRSIAAPANCVRLNRKTPCVIQGKCMDCKVPDRICSSILTLAYQGQENRIKVIIIGENYGY